MSHYAIRKGRKNNLVVDTWEECSALVTSYPGAIFKSFKPWQLDEARAFASGRVPRVKNGHRLVKYNKSDFNKNSTLKPYQVCLHRGLFEGKMRCLIRHWGETVGKDYAPEPDNDSVPW